MGQATETVMGRKRTKKSVWTSLGFSRGSPFHDGTKLLRLQRVLLLLLFCKARLSRPSRAGEHMDDLQKVPGQFREALVDRWCGPCFTPGNHVRALINSTASVSRTITLF